MYLSLGQSTMMKKIRSCAMLVATANTPNSTSPSLRDRAVQSTQLRMKTIVKRFICRCTVLAVGLGLVFDFCVFACFLDLGRVPHRYDGCFLVVVVVTLLKNA